MTNDEIAAAKAAFLARGGQVTKADAGVASGVDAEADKAKRKAARAAEAAERCSETEVQRIREEHGYFKS